MSVCLQMDSDWSCKTLFVHLKFSATAPLQWGCFFPARSHRLGNWSIRFQVAQPLREPPQLMLFRPISSRRIRQIMVQKEPPLTGAHTTQKSCTKAKRIRKDSQAPVGLSCTITLWAQKHARRSCAPGWHAAGGVKRWRMPQEELENMGRVQSQIVHDWVQYCFLRRDVPSFCGDATIVLNTLMNCLFATQKKCTAVL